MVESALSLQGKVTSYRVNIQVQALRVGNKNLHLVRLYFCTETCLFPLPK